MENELMLAFACVSAASFSPGLLMALAEWLVSDLSGGRRTARGQ